MLNLIRLYQRWLSPFLPPHCRFEPSCSAYAVEAIEQHGIWRGGRLALARVGRCHPFGAAGYDPVPTLGQSPCCKGQCSQSSSEC